MPLAAIELAFDPVLRVGWLDIRWQTVGVTLALLAALALAARAGSYLPPRPASEAAATAGRADGASARLRLDDLAYIVLAVVPGAVIGGRIVHGLVYWDAYAADPLRLLDAGVGSLSLLGAVLGGTLTGAYVTRLLGAPLRRWADAVAVPLLLAIGLGKLAQLLGGSGQGAPFDGAWAVAFVGDGPWHALSPSVAAHPAQVYEALWALAGVFVLWRLGSQGARPAGALLSIALGWFVAGRLLVGFTWRDDDVLGPLNAEQLIATVVLATMAVVVLRRGAGSIVGGQETREEKAP